MPPGERKLVVGAVKARLVRVMVQVAVEAEAEDVFFQHLLPSDAIAQLDALGITVLQLSIVDHHTRQSGVIDIFQADGWYELDVPWIHGLAGGNASAEYG